MSDAKTILAETFARMITGSSAIYGARRASTLLLAQGQGALEREAATAAADFSNMSWVTEEMMGHLGGRHGVAQVVHGHQAGSLRAVIDASALVFMHAIVEDAVLRFCEVLMLLEPEEWESRIGERKVTLQDARGSSFEELRSAKLQELLQELVDRNNCFGCGRLWRYEEGTSHRDLAS